jgi:hypothetical protein
MTIDQVLQYTINFIQSLGLMPFLTAAIVIALAMFTINIITGRKE